MALKARDLIHAGQIKAGTLGRLLGHNFEDTLSKRINATSITDLLSVNPTGSHLFEGIPERLVVSYVTDRLRLEGIKGIKSYWLGGLATSGKGDECFHDITKERIKRSKSDILLEFTLSSTVRRVGISVKTCNKEKPTNAQLFCSTATAFCELLRRNDIPVSAEFENGLKMFCGDEGYRPLDEKGATKGRKSDPERWFFEELPEKSRQDIERTISKNQAKITRVLLQLAYADDPFRPEFVFHQTKKATSIARFPVAIFSIDELVRLSGEYCSFCTREYKVRKGRFKGDPNAHLAPRFGCVQFQRLGNKQNATQLQFNLEAGYFTKIIASK